MKKERMEEMKRMVEIYNQFLKESENFMKKQKKEKKRNDRRN